MKISLEEARKRATPGPLCLSEKRETCYELYGAGAIIGRLESSSSRDRDGDSVFRRRLEEAQANASLLAHCWNRFDELVVALEDLAFDAARVERKFSEGRDWTEWRDLRDKLASAKRLLAKTKTVEMP